MDELKFSNHSSQAAANKKDNVETGGILASNDNKPKPVMFEPAPSGTDNSGNFAVPKEQGGGFIC